MSNDQNFHLSDRFRSGGGPKYHFHPQKMLRNEFLGFIYIVLKGGLEQTLFRYKSNFLQQY